VLARLQSAFREMGLEYVPSYGNFVLVRVGDAAAVYEGLLRAGIIVRPVANYGLPDWLRVRATASMAVSSLVRSLSFCSSSP